MNIEEIREQLAYKISTNEIWDEKTNETEPGNYGCDDVEAEVLSSNIFVDIPNGTFTFKNAVYSFSARIGSSNDEDSVMFPFSTLATGNGTFVFTDKKNVDIAEISVIADLDLFAEDR
jgi:hypothetical protein